MTTSAAGLWRGHLDKDKDKEKVEKRRALGRGLESLLAGAAGGGAARPWWSRVSTAGYPLRSA